MKGQVELVHPLGWIDVNKAGQELFCQSWRWIENKGQIWLRGRDGQLICSTGIVDVLVVLETLHGAWQVGNT